jgi:hypothetical protein
MKTFASMLWPVITHRHLDQHPLSLSADAAGAPPYLCALLRSVSHTSLLEWVPFAKRLNEQYESEMLEIMNR